MVNAFLPRVKRLIKNQLEMGLFVPIGRWFFTKTGNFTDEIPDRQARLSRKGQGTAYIDGRYAYAGC